MTTQHCRCDHEHRQGTELVKNIWRQQRRCNKAGVRLYSAFPFSDLRHLKTCQREHSPSLTLKVMRFLLASIVLEAHKSLPLEPELPYFSPSSRYMDVELGLAVGLLD